MRNPLYGSTQLLGLCAFLMGALFPIHGVRAVDLTRYTSKTTLYVDSNNQNDPQENGSYIHPYNTIQEAINAAQNGFLVRVTTGVYQEHLNLQGKQLVLVGMNADSSTRDPLPTIMGTQTSPVVSFTAAEDPNCVLEGFIITHNVSPSGGAIYCQGSSPTIAHCLMVGHNTFSTQAPIVLCQNSQATLRHCTIAGNLNAPHQVDIRLLQSPIIIDHSIIRSMGTALAWDTHNPTRSFSNISGHPSPLDGDPLFAQPGLWIGPADGLFAEAVWVPGDYHLRSGAGHWSTVEQHWIVDQETSPCIDAGDPNIGTGLESPPHGERLNLGVYGGTSQASKSFVTDQFVYFESPVLQWAVEDALGIFDPTPADMLGLTEFLAKGTTDLQPVYGDRIRSLVGLEHATNLTKLEIMDNYYRTLTPIAGLTNLRHLDISDCVSLSDISGVSELVNLEHLDMHWNNVSNLRPLKKLVKLHTLIVRRNSLWSIRDIQHLPRLKHLDVRVNKLDSLEPLLEMTSLEELYLDDNPWTPGEFDEHIAIIRQNNPGILISY